MKCYDVKGNYLGDFDIPNNKSQTMSEKEDKDGFYNRTCDMIENITVGIIKEVLAFYSDSKAVNENSSSEKLNHNKKIERRIDLKKVEKFLCEFNPDENIENEVNPNKRVS